MAGTFVWKADRLCLTEIFSISPDLLRLARLNSLYTERCMHRGFTFLVAVCARASLRTRASRVRKGKPITCAGKKDEGALCMYVCEDLSVALKRTESLSIVLAKLDPLLCSNGNINIAEGRALLRNFDAFYRDIRYASTAGDFLAKKLRRNGATENSPVSTMVPLFHFSFFLLYNDLSPLYCSQM